MNNMGVFLPLGTVVVLKGATKKLMIIGHNVVSDSVSNRTYDYLACGYPEGFVSKDENMFLNHEQIDNVIYRGFSEDNQVNVNKNDVGVIKPESFEIKEEASVESPKVDTNIMPIPNVVNETSVLQNVEEITKEVPEIKNEVSVEIPNVNTNTMVMPTLATVKPVEEIAKNVELSIPEINNSLVSSLEQVEENNTLGFDVNPIPNTTIQNMSNSLSIENNSLGNQSLDNNGVNLSLEPSIASNEEDNYLENDFDFGNSNNGETVAKIDISSNPGIISHKELQSNMETHDVVIPSFPSAKFMGLEETPSNNMNSSIQSNSLGVEPPTFGANNGGILGVGNVNDNLVSAPEPTTLNDVLPRNKFLVGFDNPATNIETDNSNNGVGTFL